MIAVEIAEDRSLRAVEVAEPPLAPGEVRVGVAFCGVCGSDLHLRPSAAIPAGSVMGHELSGHLLEVGAGVDGWSVGDRVCVFPFLPCGVCPLCVAGHEQICIEAATTGLGMGTNRGGFAETVSVPASALFRLPEAVSDRDGALVEPLAVALHGITIGAAEPDDPVAIIGAGPIGVMTALALRARGFERVAVIERGPDRARRIAELGFPAVGLDEVHMRTIEALGGALPATVFECAGNPAAPQLAVELVAPKGRVVLLGVLEEPVAISQLVLMVKEAEIRSSFAYRREDFAEAIELIAERRIPTAALVTGVEPLDRADDVFAALAVPGTEHLKVLLRP